MKIARRFSGHKSCYDCRWRGYVTSEDRRSMEDVRERPVLSPHVCLARLVRVPVRVEGKIVAYDLHPMNLCSSAEAFLMDPTIRVHGGKIWIPGGATSRDIRFMPSGKLDESVDADAPMPPKYYVVTVRQFLDDELRAGWCKSWLPSKQSISRSKFYRLICLPKASDSTLVKGGSC